MMITCTSCGSVNGEDDAFCGSCSAFLEWDGAPAPDAVPVPVPVTVPVPGPGPSQGEQAASEPSEHRRPQAEERRPAPRRGVSAGPTDLFCGACGAGNATGRAFCRRCGSALADAASPAAATTSWWQRLVRALRRLFRREAEPLAAGERPDSWERLSRQPRTSSNRRWLRLPSRISVGRLAIPLMLLSLLGFSLTPVRATVTTFVYDAYESVRRVVAPVYVPVTATGAVADSEVEGRAALSAIDQNTTTAWAEGREGAGVGAVLTVSFESPTDLSRIGVLNGAPGADYALEPRLRTVQLDLTDVAGGVATERLELDDTPDFRTYDVAGSAVVQVRVTVVDVYPGQQGEAASLTEVSFHARR